LGRTKTIEDDEILSRARELFRKEGHAASTRDIAEAAGISQAVLYQRFGSKEELFFRAMAPEMPNIEGLLGPYPPRNVRADLGRIGERLAAYLAAHLPTVLHVLAHPDLGRERLLKLHQQLSFHPLVGALAERFKRLRDDGLIAEADPFASARAFLSLVHAFAFSELMTHGSHRGGHGVGIHALVDVLWTGLAPTRAGGQRRAQHTGRGRAE
jgi:AcrR family transcriptional regulator